MASGDTIGSADEVAAIIGAPKAETMRMLLQALHEKNAEQALDAIAKAQESHADMKLFMRLLLERVRAVVLVRNAPRQQEALFAAFGPADQELIKKLAGDASSALNSHVLLALLDAAQLVGKTALPHLPLELAVIESCKK
jgi:DNA polymerase III gamma/tau subunit